MYAFLDASTKLNRLWISLHYSKKKFCIVSICVKSYRWLVLRSPYQVIKKKRYSLPWQACQLSIYISSTWFISFISLAAELFMNCLCIPEVKIKEGARIILFTMPLSLRRSIFMNQTDMVREYSEIRLVHEGTFGMVVVSADFQDYWCWLWS